MKSIIRTLVGAAALLASGSALADGYADKSNRPVIAEASWSGLFVGAHVGYGWDGAASQDFRPAGVFPNNAAYAVDGWQYGVHAGAQHQYGRIVGGVEVSYSLLDVQGGGNDRVDPTAAHTTTIRNLLMVNGRLGLAMDKAHVYITGGYAGSNVDSKAFAIALPSQSIGETKWHGGWNLGAGVEYKITDRIVAGLEYRHVELNDVIHAGLNTFGAPVAPRNHVVDASMDLVTARLSILIGRSEPSEPLK